MCVCVYAYTYACTHTHMCVCTLYVLRESRRHHPELGHPWQRECMNTITEREVRKSRRRTGLTQESEAQNMYMYITEKKSKEKQTQAKLVGDSKKREMRHTCPCNTKCLKAPKKRLPVTRKSNTCLQLLLDHRYVYRYSPLMSAACP